MADKAVGLLWEWLEKEGKTAGLKLGDKTFSLAGATPDQVANYAENFGEAMEAYAIVINSRAAFALEPSDDIKAATRRLGTLFRLDRLVLLDLEATANGVSQFFEPAGLHEAFKGQSARFKDFILEAIQRLVKVG